MCVEYLMYIIYYIIHSNISVFGPPQYKRRHTDVIQSNIVNTRGDNIQNNLVVGTY